jgi:hypothetical protein
MSLRRHAAGGLAGFCLLAAFAGCGGDDLVFPGMILPTPVPSASPTCVQSGGSCTLSSDCCSNNCFSPDGVTLQCQ